MGKGVITSYKRARKDLTPNECLVKIEGVNTQEQTNFYKGKKVAYVYKCKTLKKNSKYRVIWGKVRRAQGQEGCVRVQVQDLEEELQVPSDLGQGPPRPRPQRYGEGCLSQEPALHVVWRSVQNYAVPVQHLNGCCVRWCLAFKLRRDSLEETKQQVSHWRRSAGGGGVGVSGLGRACFNFETAC